MEGEKKLEIALEGMLESTRLQVEEVPPVQCAYVIKQPENVKTEPKRNLCWKAMYDQYYKCGYLINKKECSR